MNDLNIPAINDLRTALAFAKENGFDVIDINDELSGEFEVANHYVSHFAGVPASSVSRPEPIVRYNNVAGHSIPVLMGLYGNRRLNQLLLTGDANKNYQELVMMALQKKIKPVIKEKPICQQVVLDRDINLRQQLPILNLTPRDAGPFITLGLILARDPNTGEMNSSINRLCVQDNDTMTVSIFPGHHLGLLLADALAKNESLPISINLGLDPAIYFASCLTEPVCEKGDDELDIAGGMRGKAVEVSNCLTVAADCISNAEIVIEAEIISETMAENNNNPANGSMPEFLGYQGVVPPDSECPVVKVRAITHRKDPIYQSVVGPGLEQSELQSITPEIATRIVASQFCPVPIKNVVFNTAGGGVISAVLQADKQSAEDDKILVAAAQALLQKIPPLKHLYIVDTDIDPHSVEDVLWAMTTRFQADIDFYPQRSERRFMPDPSQWPPYREDPQELPMKALFDCTVPFKLKNIFRRAFQPN